MLETIGSRSEQMLGLKDTLRSWISTSTNLHMMLFLLFLIGATFLAFLIYGLTMELKELMVKTTFGLE